MSEERGRVGDLTFAPGKPADQLLVEFALTGRQEPFEEIVRRYAPMVFGTCMRVLKNKHDAEDAVQAVFLSLAVQAKANREIRYLGPWLQQVAHRVSLDVRRGKKRRKAREEKHNEIRTANLTTPATPGDVEEMKRIIAEELGKLPAKYRVPLVLFYFGGMSREQIATELKCNPSTLGVRMHRAREMLGTRLSARGVALTPVVLAYLLGEAVKSAVGDALIHSTSRAAAHITAAHLAQVKVGAAMASSAVQEVVSSNVLRLAQGAAARSAAVGRMKTVLAMGMIVGTALAAGAGAMTKAVPALNLSSPVQRLVPQFDGTSWIGEVIRRAAEKLLSAPTRLGAAVGEKGAAEVGGARSEVAGENRGAGHAGRGSGEGFGPSLASSASGAGGSGGALGAVAPLPLMRVAVAVTNAPRWEDRDSGGAVGERVMSRPGVAAAPVAPVVAGGMARAWGKGSGWDGGAEWDSGAVSGPTMSMLAAARHGGGDGGASGAGQGLGLGPVAVGGGLGAVISPLAMQMVPSAAGAVSSTPVYSSPAAPPASPATPAQWVASGVDAGGTLGTAGGAGLSYVIASSAVAANTPVAPDTGLAGASRVLDDASFALAAVVGPVRGAAVSAERLTMAPSMSLTGTTAVPGVAMAAVSSGPAGAGAVAGVDGAVALAGVANSASAGVLRVSFVRTASVRTVSVRTDSVQVVAPTTVPEPSGAVVMTAAVAGFVALRRRRQRGGVGAGR